MSVALDKPKWRPIPTPVSCAALQVADEPRPAADFAGRRVHFMGAGGIGVSALMELCAARGGLVSGCDVSAGGQVPTLRARGIRIHEGHSPAHIDACDELVYSAAVSSSHPEIQEAEHQRKPVSIRMRMLGRIARGLRSVCVTGAHGKTTTTWLISHMLISAGRDPSVLLGGVTKELRGNVRVGQGREFVAEVDESDNRLSEVVPTIPVLTNIDNDHLEHYGSVDAIEAAATAFLASVNTSDPTSVLIGCGEDPRVRRALETASALCRRPVIEYGFQQHCQMRALNVRAEELSSRFDVLGPFGLWADVQLPMPGQHNVLNALAAVSAGWHLGVNEETMRRALASVSRVGRRFEIKGVKSGVRVIDDYGHHPTEIKATLSAVRQSAKKRVGVLFQPHRYTRTAALLDQFAVCFSDADAIFLLPVYAASEESIAGVDHHVLAGAIRTRSKRPVHVAGSRAEAVQMALKWIRAGDTLVTQGAGDITRAADELLAGL